MQVGAEKVVIGLREQKAGTSLGLGTIKPEEGEKVQLELNSHRLEPVIVSRRHVLVAFWMSEDGSIALGLNTRQKLPEVHRRGEIGGLDQKTAISERKEIPFDKPALEKAVHHVLRSEMKTDWTSVGLTELGKPSTQPSSRIGNVLHDMRSKPDLPDAKRLISREDAKGLFHSLNPIVHSWEDM